MKRFLIPMVLGMAALSLTAQELTPPVIDVAAKHFQFTPGQITLRRGETITLRFAAQDRNESVYQKDLRIDLKLTPDHTSEVTITPARRGRFVAVCPSCGPEQGTIVIDVE